MTTRRNFLKQASLLSGTAALPHVLPEAIQRALAINPTPGTTFYDAEHVVFLMQENRSFDHMFGTLRGVRGFNDPHPHILPNQDKVWLQRDEKGNAYTPFHIDLNETKVTWQGGLAHSWPDQIAARNNGKYDQWVPVKSVMSLAYYKRQDLPFYYALADAFTICDHHFCSSLTGTTPNRLFYWTGNIRPNPNDKSSKPVVSNHQAESHNNNFVDWPTFPELLEDHGIDWRVYQNEIWTAKLPTETDDWLGNYGDNALEYVKRHKVRLSAYFRKNGDKTINPNLSAEEVLEKYNALSQREKNLIDKAFTTNIDDPDYLTLAPLPVPNETDGTVDLVDVPKSDIFYQFRKDVNEGKLPTVSWLVAPQRFSDHTSSPLYGTWYVSEALNILTQNPEVWKKTIFIVNYDENDGYYDHMPPFVAPKPRTAARGKVSDGIDTASDYEAEEGSPIGLGYRVPMIVASPWSRGGYVNSQIFDHTSTLMFLENFLYRKTGKQLKSEQISSWRRAVCGDLTSVFRPYHGAHMHQPNPLERAQVIQHIQQVQHKPKQEKPHPLKAAEVVKINAHHAFQDGSSALLAKQEKGTKPACALPYDFTADARLNETKTSIVIAFAAGKGVGVPFNVSALNSYGGEQGRNWYFAVKANDKLFDNWEIDAFHKGKYDLSVHGPNGFYRRFSGSKRDPDLLVNCVFEQQGIAKANSGNLQVLLQNKEAKAVEILIDDVYKTNHKTIKLKAGEGKIVTLNLKKHQHWYNFFLTVKGFDGYKKHYAGHVETGKESITDPYMGGVL